MLILVVILGVAGYLYFYTNRSDRDHTSWVRRAEMDMAQRYHPRPIVYENKPKIVIDWTKHGLPCEKCSTVSKNVGYDNFGRSIWFMCKCGRVKYSVGMADLQLRTGIGLLVAHQKQFSIQKEVI